MNESTDHVNGQTGEALSIVQIGAIKDLVDQLHFLGLSPLHLHIDAKHVGDQRPDVRLWLRYRTDLERYAAAVGRTPKPARFDHDGQRSWSFEHDTPERRLLVQCVSLRHHHDWQETR